ncbi:MAG: Maf family protein [Candidatus Ornithospirochaeta sp.]
MDRIQEPTPLQHRFSSLFPTLVLASSSPNRRKLLEKGGSIVSVYSPNADEDISGMEREEAMKKNARVKMEDYLSSTFFNPSLPAISADTLVHIDSFMLGKPKDRDDAYSTLSLLSGRKQEVLTGTALYIPGEKEIMVFCDKAEVIFKDLSEEEIQEYLDRDEWKGAAGAYRLQKTGWTLVDEIKGDWTTVVGLPLERLSRIMEERQPRSSS